LPSERRRLQKEAKAAEKRAKEEARAAAEAAAVAEANAVLERQAARPDATAAILTSVLLKRGGTASPEVVARTRAKRDSLKAAEMRARKPVKAMLRRRLAMDSPSRPVFSLVHPLVRPIGSLCLRQHLQLGCCGGCFTF
jgi:hypothetical protein